MHVFRSEFHIRIKKFGDLLTGELFFYNNLPFIKLDTDYLQNAICLDDGIMCHFRYNDDVEFQYCGYFRSKRCKDKKCKFEED